LTDVVTSHVYQPTTTITVTKPADLHLDASGPGAIAPGAPLTYTLRIGNLGPNDTEESIVVTDVLPNGVIYSDASPGGMFSSTLNALTWPIDPLTVGATRTLTVTAVAPIGSIGTLLTSTASISIPTQDPDVNNNRQAWYTWLGDRPNLLNATNKAVTPIDLAGGRVATYTVQIMNSGTLSASAIISDPLPSGVRYQAGSSTIDGMPLELYDATSNQIEWAGSIAPAHSIELQFRVETVAFGGEAINTVIINDGTDTLVERSARLVLPYGSFLPLILK
jgi:uncharacterized repeat protein (TIGR01451 family)